MICLLCAVLLAADPEPTAEELAFKLVSNTKVATACTMHAKGPFGSTMPYALDAEGRPLVFLSDLAVHTKNLKRDAKASLFINESAKGDLDKARLTLIGEMKVVPKKELEAAQKQYFERFPKAKIYASFHDFNLYRLEMTDIYYVGGFGPKPIDWLDVKKYKEAAKPKKEKE